MATRLSAISVYDSQSVDAPLPARSFRLVRTDTPAPVLLEVSAICMTVRRAAILVAPDMLSRRVFMSPSAIGRKPDNTVAEAAVSAAAM